MNQPAEIERLIANARAHISAGQQCIALKQPVDLRGLEAVVANIAGQAAAQNVGQFEVNTFPNESGLEGIGNNLFLETPASGSAVTGIAGAAGFGSLLQGFLETSNVNAVAEITSLITAQRAYELNSKVITTSDEMMAAVNQMR